MAFLLASLLSTLNSVAYAGSVDCKTNLVPKTTAALLDKASTANLNTNFVTELSADGVVMTDRILPNNPAVKVSARINVAATDVGQLAEVLFVARFNGSFYMKTPQGWQPWDLQLKNLVATGSARKLAAIEDLDIETQLTLPGNFDVYIGYCRSQGNMQYSQDPLTFSLLAPTKPDLSVSLLTLSPKTIISSAIINSGNLILKATVSNSGDVGTEGTVLHYYRSSDAVINSSDSKVCDVNIPALAISASSTIGCQVPTSAVPGTYFYGACVDSVENEGNVTNNCSVGEAMTVSAAPSCTLPQVLQNGVCVTPTPSCTLPQVLQNGVCIAPTPTPTATPTPTPTPSCISPQVLQNGLCVTPNRAPVASAGSATTSQNTAKVITLVGTDADGNALVYSAVTAPVHGSVSISGNSATYTPAANYSGADSFTFKVNDGKLDSAVAAITITVQAVVTKKINDTGISSSQCYSTGSNALIDCAMELAKNLNPFQDGMLGRDVTSNDNSDGHAGFSFTKLCNSGEIAGRGACPSSPIVGSAANAWGCTKDNITGLIWEVKTEDGQLHDKGLDYYNYTATYNPDVGSGIGYGASVDASGFVRAVNASGFCGSSSWRLPTVEELLGLVDYGFASPGPLIDSTFFPSTAQKEYWTSSRSFIGNAGRESVDVAWQVSFSNGAVFAASRGKRTGAVRLVRDSN